MADHAFRRIAIGAKRSRDGRFILHPEAGVPLSRPVMDAALSLSALQRVRVQIGVATFPPFRGEGVRFTVRPQALGVQLDLPL